jgi:hypothetical protein
MEAFLARALNLPAATQDSFIDDEDSIFENDTNKLAESGITRGCNSPQQRSVLPRQFSHTQSEGGLPRPGIWLCRCEW